jgi:hypothetical protein
MTPVPGASRHILAIVISRVIFLRLGARRDGSDPEEELQSIPPNKPEILSLDLLQQKPYSISVERTQDAEFALSLQVFSV